ncbi:interferon-induced very large GTPase 1 [Larimichthys crocea]|uniref:interferon-induced very large GTPase 1 n=1 Tax=Larimichthys crocea TaxID=215358 RepID=UPI000F5EDFC7|nr:interferon-induced very large GTPase 1 [Larimichthys crocea]
MSVKLPKRLSSKKKKPPKDNAQAEVLNKLGLEAFSTTPLDPPSMLDISTWTLKKQEPLEPKNLPYAFLQRLWLLSPDARSPMTTKCNVNNDNKLPEEMISGSGESQCAINPLDLVTAVFMSANTFLQQEITMHMMQCQFAVPLVLPDRDPEKPNHFLIWPLRGVVSQWRSHFPDRNREVHEGNLASTYMPMVSCVKLGRCGVSKSQVLNNVINGLGSPSETFLHRGMDGGQLPRRLSNGLVEIGWYLPTGDNARDIFPVPVVISNLRGDANTHEKILWFLCQTSSAVVVFCGDLREKEKLLLSSCKDMASKLILIDVSEMENNENRVVGFVNPTLEEDIGLPGGSVLQGGTLSAEELANRLCDILKDLLPDLKLVTLEGAAKLAEELGLNVDEGAVFKKAMATVEELLKGLDEGSAQFREKQLPLQGHLWSKLAEIEKEERKKKEINNQLQKEKKDILAELRSYKMTPAMKIFTNALFTTDKVERACFLSWMKLKLQLMQTEKPDSLQNLLTSLQRKKNDCMPNLSDELENGNNDDLGDSDSFCTESTFEEEQTEEQTRENNDMLNGSNELENGNNDDLGDSDSFCTESTFEEEQTEEWTRENNDMLNGSNELQNGANGHRGDCDTCCSESTSEEEQTEEQPVNTELQVPEQQFETGQKLEHIVQSTHEVIDQRFYMASNEKEIQGKELIENNVGFEGSNSDPVYVGQNGHLKSGENGTLSNQHQDEPELTLAESDLTSSVQQTCQDVSFEHQVAPCSQPLEPSLGLEHFLREMSLIFELTHISPGSGSQNVLRLPSIATELLFYGIPLELMDGDASNIPIHWLSCVFAKLGHRLPQERSRTRVLTNLGVHNSMNAEVLSALFGVKFPEGRKRSTRGLYMVALCLPDELKKDMECDFLLLIDVEGLCSDNQRNTLIHDNEMATVATGLSDVLMHNISSHAGTEFETDFTVIASALLRIKECGSMPICQLLAQDEDISCLLQASQLKHVTDVLQTKTAKTTRCITCVKGPWNNMSLSEPVDLQYTKAVLKLKKNLFGALKKCAAKSEATGLPGIMSRLCAVWDAVRADSYSIELQNTDIALAFSLFCTEHSEIEDRFLEHIESWLVGATEKIFAPKANALDAAIQNNLLSELKDEARKEVKTEVDKLRSKVEASLKKDNYLKISPCKPVLMSHMDDLQERVTEEIIQKLDTVNESHCSSSQLTNFEIILEKEQESKLQALIKNSKSTKVLLQDTELEEEFDGMWSKILSNFDFRPSEKDDITTRVINILKKNLLSRGLRKHMKKVEDIHQNQPSTFYAYDEHFGYRSRLKHIDDNNRLQRLQAQQLACKIIEEYNQFVADKSSSHVDFTDSFITEQLENVEKALKEKSMEIRSAFEVDLKVYLCRAACQDFQKLHDCYAKDKELLTYITANKSVYLAEFVYQFRKRDQCQRAAQAFTSMVLKPTVLDYIYRPLGMSIVEEIRGKGQQYRSRRAFHHSLLEELIKEDSFESFLEYLHSYDNFSMRKIKETVDNHLSETTNLDILRQKRLGDIVGKIVAAVSETAEGTNGVLSDSKPLLERVCLTLERDSNVDVTRASLDGPLFSISTEWDRFITCLMELLAAMRLDLAQEFSQNVDITQLLQCLPIQPQDYLFNRLRGCDKHCPLCGAPCELEEMGHTVHEAVLHRPKGMWPNDSCSLPGISCPESMTEDNPDQSTDTHDMSVPCTHLHSLYPDWSISPEHPDSQMPSAYWRYVLARFNEKFAEKYEREPAKIPDKWKMITVEEARDSLNEAFLSGQY